MKVRLSKKVIHSPEKIDPLRGKTTTKAN